VFSKLFDFFQKTAIRFKSSFFINHHIIIDTFFLYSSYYSDF